MFILDYVIYRQLQLSQKCFETKQSQGLDFTIHEDTSDSKSSTSSNSSSHQNKKEQKPKAQNRSLSQRQSKAEKNPVQVHNRYGRLDDAEEESAWNLPPDDSPSPMDESPSETRRSPSRSPKGGRRKGSQRKKSFSPIRHP